MNMTIGGTLADPLPQGRLAFANGSLSYATLPSGLSELKRFSRVHLAIASHIETLTARTGGGTLAFQGDATYLNQQLNSISRPNGKERSPALSPRRKLHRQRRFALGGNAFRFHRLRRNHHQQNRRYSPGF